MVSRPVILKQRKENKMEERNITISLEKAKEWYNIGGDLKKVALQAFSEDELKDKFPTSWEDYLKSKTYRYGSPICSMASKQLGAYNALGKLIQLRDEYWRLDGDWKPSWKETQPKYAIYLCRDNIVCDMIFQVQHILVFRTLELRNKFYNNFKDIIAQAKMFL